MDPIPERSLALLGTLLAGQNERVGIVIVGGSALLLRGDITRATQDVDVIALVDPADRSRLIQPGAELPPALRRAAAVVAEELALAPDWLDSRMTAQWIAGMPPDLETGLAWYEYGGLLVGVAGRDALIALKLFAAVDGGRAEKHFQDLVALAPTDLELERASQWVVTQDASETFPDTITQVIADVCTHRR
jgi:hypothetical protein